MRVRPQFVAVRSLRQLDAALEGLTLINVAQLTEPGGVLRDAGGTPRSVGEAIADGTVIYQRRDEGETWLTLVDLVERGEGDCEDLACALAAEIRVHRRTQARAVSYVARPGLVHVVVELPGGRRLDPSITAGMEAP